MGQFDDIDPLDAAFANPKAGKKLKPGEALPGMEHRSSAEFDTPDLPDAALSAALDDAFSARKFDAPSQQVSDPQAEAGLVAAAEEKLARSLDDAFANPKKGEKISAHPADQGITPKQLGLKSYTPEVDIYDVIPPAKVGWLSPKILVLGMLLAMVLFAVVFGSVDRTPVKPNVIRLTD